MERIVIFLLIKLRKHWGVSTAAVCGIGPQLALNSASVPIQELIQKSFHTTLNLSLPLILSLLSVALFVPLGPILRHRIGARNNYILSIMIFIIGSFVCILSSSMIWYCLGRVLQGMGTGMLFMMMIPMLVLAFPIQKRDLAIIVLTGGLFGSAIIGQYLGYVAAELGQYMFLYITAVLVALLGIFAGFIYLNNERSKEHSSVDLKGYSLLILFGLFYSFALFLLQSKETSVIIEKIIVIGSIVVFLLFVYREYKQEVPLLAIKEIVSLKLALIIFLLLIGNLIISICFIGGHELLRQFDLVATGWRIISIGIFVGLLIAIILNYMLYDRIGPGYLALIGSFILLVVNLFISFSPAEYMSLIMVSFCLGVLIAGIGITIISGLLGVALGGALPKLIQRMTVVQFIRFSVAGGMPLLNEVIFKNIIMNDTGEEDSNEAEGGKRELAKILLLNKMTNYQEYFFLSTTLSVILVCLSFGIALTGKGHKLAHKSHSMKKINSKS